MKLLLKDFQIIQDGEVPFKEGFTVILGASNNGKTAIFRSLDTLLYPESLRLDHIRIGSTETRITLETNDNTLTMTRGTSTPKAFTLNGSLVSIGDAKSAIRSQLGLKSIQVGNQNFDVNFWRQMDSPFLINIGPPTLFDFFSRVSKQEKVQEASRQLQKDIKEMNTSLTKEEAVVNYQKIELSSLMKKGSSYYRYKEAIMLIEEGNKIRNKLNALYTTLTTIGELREKIVHQNTVVNIFQEYHGKIQSFVKEFEEVETKYRYVTGLIQEVQKYANQIKSMNATMQVAKRVVDWYNESGMEEQIASLKEIREKLAPLKDMIYRIGLLESKQKDMIEKISYYENSIAKLQEILQRFDVCPLCGGSLDHK